MMEFVNGKDDITYIYIYIWNEKLKKKKKKHQPDIYRKSVWLADSLGAIAKELGKFALPWRFKFRSPRNKICVWKIPWLSSKYFFWNGIHASSDGTQIQGRNWNDPLGWSWPERSRNLPFSHHFPCFMGRLCRFPIFSGIFSTGGSSPP